jgi:hypothetical protein
MFANLVGLPTASITFLAVTTAVSPYFGQGLPLLLGALAAWTTWFLFKAIDKRQEEKLLYPDPETWNVSLPIVWGVIREVFGGQTIKTNRGNLVHWQITHEDQSTGKMSAICTLNEDSRVAVSITLESESQGTRFNRRYEHSGDIGAVIEVIQAEEILLVAWKERRTSQGD